MNTNTLLAIAIIVVILWAVGFFAAIGPLINILLVIAVILIVVWLLTGKKLWK